MRIFSQYIQAQILFELKIYDLTPTWVEQTLDSICSKFIRDWLELSISACLNEVLILPKNQGGFGMNSFKMLADKMRLIKRHALINSPDDDLRSIAFATVKSHCRIDEYIAGIISLILPKNHLIRLCQNCSATCIKFAAAMSVLQRNT